MADAARGPTHALLELFEESGRNVQRTALLLRDCSPTTRSAQRRRRATIVDCEHEGDRIAHDILHRARGERPRAARRPSRPTCHALAGALDDIVDYAEEAADQLGLYGVEAPMEQAQAIADVLVGATERGRRARCAGCAPAPTLAPHLVEIHRLENEADRIVREAVASLFADGIDPMVVIRWKDIFESLEAAVDACETVANVLEGIAHQAPVAASFTPARGAEVMLRSRGPSSPHAAAVALPARGRRVASPTQPSRDGLELRVEPLDLGASPPRGGASTSRRASGELQARRVGELLLERA